MNLDAIRLLVLDVDGVLTDGTIMMTEQGDLVKSFYVQDGYALKRWSAVGGETAIISGRASETVSRRAAELGISHVRQGISDKLAAYERLLGEVGVDDTQVSYVGDDYPDLEPMQRCAFPVAVANAVPELKRQAACITLRCGGHGAVAEVVELILRTQGRWR